MDRVPLTALGRSIGRTALAVGTAFCIVVAGLGTWLAITERITAGRLRDRTAYWNAAVSSGVAVGDTRRQAEEWFRETYPHSERARAFYRPDRHALVGDAEVVKVMGLKFPCAAWYIAVEVQLGPDDRVVSRGAKMEGICV
jgi:hypothetical protein